MLRAVFPRDWVEFLGGESMFDEWPEWRRVSAWLEGADASDWTPSADPREWVRPFVETRPQDVRVVLLASEPEPDAASGLAFDSPRLRPIVEAELARASTGDEAPAPRLTRSVLLLNLCWTSRKGERRAHVASGFVELSRRILCMLARRQTVFAILCGLAVQGALDEAFRAERILRTSTSYPSPEFHDKTAEPFTGSRCFAIASETLRVLGVCSIQWPRSLCYCCCCSCSCCCYARYHGTRRRGEAEPPPNLLRAGRPSSLRILASSFLIKPLSDRSAER